MNHNRFSSTLTQLTINVLVIVLSVTTILPQVKCYSPRKNNDDYESCLIDTEDWPSAPWLAHIEFRVASTSPQRYPAAIVGPNLIATWSDGAPNRMFRSKSRELRLLPVQNYTVFIERNSSTQEIEIASVKLHPNISEVEVDWTASENDLVFVVLKTRIEFSDDVRPICWPQWKNRLEMDRTLEGVDKLFMTGWNIKRNLASYYLQVYPEEYCVRRWREIFGNPNALYQNRMCGLVLPPENQTYTDCLYRVISVIPMRSGSAIGIGNVTFTVGFLSSFFTFGEKDCHKNALVYTAHFVPELAVWGQNLLQTSKNSKCNPASDYFCDSADSCIPLSSLCDGHEDCISDGSDESQKYCRAFDCCYKTSGNASLGRDAYPSNSKCSSIVDNAGDEDNFACLPLPEGQDNTTLVGSVVGGFVFFALIVTILTFVIVRKIKQRNEWKLSDDEVKDFFDGITSNTFEREGKDTVNSCSGEKDREVLPLPMPKLKEKVEESDYKKFPFSFNIDKKKFQFDRRYPKGKGVSGIVYEGLIEGQVCGIKVPHESIDKQLFKTFLDELKVLAYIKTLGGHKNVVSLVGAYTKEIQKLEVYVAVEYCSNGCLLEYLTSHRAAFDSKIVNSVQQNGNFRSSYIQLAEQQFNMSHLQKWSLQIAEGMRFLSVHKIIHGDLATRNILLDSNRDAKISDFGLSRRIYYYNLPNVDLGEETKVPWRWMAPEALDNMSLSCKSDVWSFGVSLWEIFSVGAIPYCGLDWTPETVNKLVNGIRLSRPEYASDKIFTIMQKCWNLVPEERPEFTEIVRLIIQSAEFCN